MRVIRSYSSFSSVAVNENHHHQTEPNQLKTVLKPKENTKNYSKTDFLMAVISGLIPFWKLMRNCHRRANMAPRKNGPQGLANTTATIQRGNSYSPGRFCKAS